MSIHYNFQSLSNKIQNSVLLMKDSLKIPIHI